MGIFTAELGMSAKERSNRVDTGVSSAVLGVQNEPEQRGSMCPGVNKGRMGRVRGVEVADEAVGEPKFLHLVIHR